MDMRRAMNLVETASRLTETRSAPLYHGSPLAKLARIIADNVLGRPGYDVSLTRSYQVAHYFKDYGDQPEFSAYGGILVLDQARLTSRFRMAPIADPWTHHSGHMGFKDEQEERVRGPIQPLSNYLISINIEPSVLKACLTDRAYAKSEEMETAWADDIAGLRRAVRAIQRHPKLNAWHPRLTRPITPDGDGIRES